MYIYVCMCICMHVCMYQLKSTKSDDFVTNMRVIKHDSEAATETLKKYVFSKYIISYVNHLKKQLVVRYFDIVCLVKFE